ncbi:MAG: ribosome biosis GTPase [Proteobacteria bacterium]|nr:ribosome biosis GTPase [Pseudomonadota bacterium]
MKERDPGHDQARAGRIVAAHGRRVVVGDGDTTHSCRLFGRRLNVVCGDLVRWVPADAEGAGGIVVGVEPRRSELARISQAGAAEAIVANLDQLVAVLAPLPSPDFSLCDRYLAAAEWAGLSAALALNKADLPEAGAAAIRAELDTYREIGYPVVLTSKKLADGAAGLRGLLRDRVSVLVGQSGVGKSSLINLLVPGVEAEVRAISRATEEGRHTTTASALYRLPGGGDLIDSPGVRDFSPPLPAPRDVASGFRELAAAAPDCRFPDCRHTGEPGCAVEPLAASGRISRRRLASYRHLLKLATDVGERLRTSGRLRPKPGRGSRFRR